MSEGDPMERVTVRFPAGVLAAADEAADEGLYDNRSRAVVDAVREKFVEDDEPIVVPAPTKSHRALARGDD